MKKVLLTSAVLAALIFSGCSSKDPSIDATRDANAGQSGVGSGETISANSGVDAQVTGTDSNEMSMSGLESKLQSVHFAFDKFELTDDMQTKVVGNADMVKADANSYSVKVEGNCDEWGSDEYNYALGLKRANTVKASLVNQGINAERISMVSYGESNPVCNDKTKECWAQNRRVDFKLLP
ncbi:MAG: OmpA family protein [Campylobacterales bacterium]|nr:OmpA family protein [Campylobacterales bacterium]